MMDSRGVKSKAKKRNAWRLAVLVLATFAFVPRVVVAAPGKPAPKPSASASASAPALAPTVAPGPTVDFWGPGGPPPEKPPPASPPPAPVAPSAQDLPPATPSEEGQRNSRYFAFAVLVGGAFCFFLAISRRLRGDEVLPNEVAAPPAKVDWSGTAGQPQAVPQPAMPPPQPSSPQVAQPRQMSVPPAQGSNPQLAQPRQMSIPPMQGQDSPAIGEVVAGRYRIDNVLGRDELAVTYQVAASDGNTYALYALRLEHGRSPQHHGRMQEIARSWSQAPQPGRRVVDFQALPDGRPYLVIAMG